MSKNNISIIIPTLSNTIGLLELVNNLLPLNIPIIVVDNGPRGLKKKLKRNKQVTYLPQKSNQGFAQSINLAVKETDTDWVWLLNDDIYLDQPKRLIDNLLRFVIQNKLTMASPVLLNSKGEIENVGYKIHHAGKINLHKKRYKKNIFSDEIDGLSATCLLINRHDFENMGGFDERFFAYLEDIDLSLRLKQAGKKFGVLTSESVLHYHMMTSKKMGLFKVKQDVKNWLLLIHKHWSKFYFLKNFHLILLERLRNLSGFSKQMWRLFSYQLHQDE